MTAVLDHLVYAVPDLEAAVSTFASAAGVAPVLGGSHPGRGTRNALVGLRWRGSARCYLELLGPDPDQPEVDAEAMMLDLGSVLATAPRMHTWAVRPDDLDATLHRAAGAGLEVGVAVSASRATPVGTRLAWRLAVPRPLRLGGLQPFLIDWEGGAHPSDAELPSVELLHLRLAHPRPDRVRDALATLGVDLADGVEVGGAESPSISIRLGTPAGELSLD